MALRWVVALGMALLAWIAAAQDTPGFKSDKEKLSYALGMSLADQIRAKSLEVDPDVLSRGLKDSLSGSKTLLSEEEVRTIVIALRKDLKGNQAALPPARRELADKNQKAGDAFLAENKAREGVVTLESGLQYKVLKTGEGRKPTIDDTVVCHYRGTLINGTVFDSSYKRGQPATFGLRRVIKGWSEALQLMPVGSKWQLFVPSSLAYGERGVGRKSNIGPNATLIFEVELISINAAQAVASTDEAAPASSLSQGGPAPTAVPVATALVGISVSFKLDPRLSGPTYGGERWVSPPTYTGANAQDTVEIKALGTDAKGKLIRISPKWIPSDPSMVTVSPSQGDAVKITVKHAGQSSLQVTSPGASKELAIKAKYRGTLIQVEIAQKQ